jgi:excinuclease UvrABC nuclease subunit
MPFASSTGYEFTEKGIAGYAPRESGVYGICTENKWIYIGEGKDMEARLYAHLRGESDESARILRHSPTMFVFERCDAATRKVREATLIRELQPAANIQGLG